MSANCDCFPLLPNLIIPVEVLKDDRLTKTDFRVLGLFFSMHENEVNSRHVCEIISVWLNLPIKEVLISQGHLIHLGYLEYVE